MTKLKQTIKIQYNVFTGKLISASPVTARCYGKATSTALILIGGALGAETAIATGDEVCTTQRAEHLKETVLKLIEQLGFSGFSVDVCYTNCLKGTRFSGYYQPERKLCVTVEFNPVAEAIYELRK